MQKAVLLQPNSEMGIGCIFINPPEAIGSRHKKLNIMSKTIDLSVIDRFYSAQISANESKATNARRKKGEKRKEAKEKINQ